MQRLLITGGAGFVGASVAIYLAQRHESLELIAFDNLARRGSELNLPRLKGAGVQFSHGDIRCWEDLEALPQFDLLIDCAAEPSVLAGTDGAAMPMIQSNLAGTVNCIELARRHRAALMFLSTSRVYPIGALNALSFTEDDSRFAWTGADDVAGFSSAGVSEDFPLTGPRSLYGATKLAAELLLTEYAFSFDLPVIINRCGILTGPWQMGKVDQGVVTLWVACHLFGRPLRYMGFGGSGKQVRDMLHIDDLCELVDLQLAAVNDWDGRVYNVGGGREISASLLELDRICKESTGVDLAIGSEPQTNPVDVRIYLSDSRRAQRDFSWRPCRDVPAIVGDVSAWIREHRELLRPVLG